ncbi:MULTISPECIES: ATP-binding protein [unclassified Massilia]|uniref:ATP-binding protein n=1 Tax=unclassified Massilia TaxID=2609279 RepID=UPI00177EAB36|nr:MULTISPECIES: ATP-binding protein [unclassified Massilia]MBD8532510.1 histidine kinase [Massilia sp. CFBP 13647]MBD8675880.1 histidine kinase [Massilia sp. CFBP 13721]
MSQRILTVALESDKDVVLVRQRARQVSRLLGFAKQDQVRIATAVSEVARAACHGGCSARATFVLVDTPARQQLEVTVSAGAVSAKGSEGAAMADQALVTAHRLMDDCELVGGAGFTVRTRKALPLQVPVSASQLGQIATELAATPDVNSYEEVQQQNRELVETLAELRERQEDLLSLTRELEDTNRGIVALYAEIEDKAERLRRADEMKSRFLSNTSHELRTPLSSIRALSKLLLDRMDGELTPEQERQVFLISRTATEMSELVNDLLDLAKIEAGRVEAQPAPVVVENLFRALKGMMRPLVDTDSVELVFDNDGIDAPFESDETMLSQILRNFISNALKFTEQGSVRVSVEPGDTADTLRFAVTDTGIGIDAEHLHLIFEEFTQVENPLQRRSKGTGLGLPLCRRLAELLGGRVDVTSRPGVGSTFTLTLPRHFPYSPPASTRDPEP